MTGEEHEGEAGEEEEDEEEYLLIDLSNVIRKVPPNMSMWLEVSCLLPHSLAQLFRKQT